MGSAFPPSVPNQSPQVQAAEDLLAYAIDRQDIKWCLSRLPSENSAQMAKIDSELQMLKIIGVGWGLNHLLAHSPLKATLQEAYWKAVQDFSGRLSETSTLLIGQRIDYFQSLKDRLDSYLAAMTAADEASEDPGRILGATLTGLCGCKGDLPVLMAAARIFNSALARVGEYLTSTGFDK